MEISEIAIFVQPYAKVGCPGNQACKQASSSVPLTSGAISPAKKLDSNVSIAN